MRRGHGVRLRHLQIHHDLHPEDSALVHGRFQHVGVMTRALADLHAVGALLMEAPNHLPGPRGRVAHVPPAEGQGPPLTEDEPGRHDVVGLGERPLLSHDLEARAGACVAKSGDSMPHPEPVLVVQGPWSQRPVVAA